MKFRIPIDLKDRRRYICTLAELSKNELVEYLKETIRELAGMKGSGCHRFSVVSMGRGKYVIRTTESSIHAILTALLFMIYERGVSIEVIGISGTLRKAREICAAPSLGVRCE